MTITIESMDEDMVEQHKGQFFDCFISQPIGDLLIWFDSKNEEQLNIKPDLKPAMLFTLDRETLTQLRDTCIKALATE